MQSYKKKKKKKDKYLVSNSFPKHQGLKNNQYRQ